jgi:hypothetical protein
MNNNSSKIEIPPKIDVEDVFNFIQELNSITKLEKIILDFTKIEYALPFGTLVLASELKQFIDSVGIDAIDVELNYNKPVYHYLKHIGFFQYIGINRGNEIGVAEANNNYLPITLIKRENLMKNYNSKILGPAIQKESEKLTKIILNIPGSTLNHPLAYCFREVIRNVFEHSQSDECILSAQRWKNGLLEIAILDRGIGIKKSLGNKFPGKDNIEILNLAIQPGVSKADIYSDKDDNVWANSGFGLYVMSEICRETGSFLLVSGESALSIENKETTDKDFSFFGTAINLKISKPKGKNVSDFIKSIISTGEKISESIPGRSKPSRISKMV